MIDTISLRRKIIERALYGELSTNVKFSESADELIERLNTAKSIWIKKGLTKKKATPKVELDEIPFSIPTHWKWSRIGAIFQHNTGKALNSSNTEGNPYEYITTSNLYWDRFELDELKSMLFKDSEIEKCTVRKGDLLVCEGGDIGRAAIWNSEDEIKIQNHIHRLRPYDSICVRFYYYIFWYYKQIGRINGKGIGLQGLSTNTLFNLVVPLPPVDVQWHISNSLDEAFNLLDTLDELQSAYSSDLEVLKSKIIDAGIQGKLTERLPGDGNAEDLYAAIQEEKNKLIKEKKIKKSKALPEITEDEIPFEIPDNWKWTHLGDLSYSIQYGYNAPAKAVGRIRMVRISDIQNGVVCWNTVPFCDIEEEDIAAYLLKENDILFARTGGTVGKSYIVSDVPEEAIFAGYLIRTSYSSKLSAKYMKFFMESNLYWKQLRNGTISTAQPNCNGQTLSKMIVPIPPFSEQIRIVEKIDNILGAIS